MERVTTGTDLTNGLASGSDEARRVILPVIPLVAYDIFAVSFVQNNGPQTAEADRLVFGLSFQEDEAALTLTTLTVGNDSHWYTRSVPGDPGHSLESFNPPRVRLAGPQTLLVSNLLGVTIFYKVVIYYELVRVPSLQDWTLLKTRTSFEGVA